MNYVSTTDCHKYYRRSGLEMAALWPKHAACGRAFEGDECMWSAGTVLAAYQNNKWRLVGVGLFGPGCSAPSKYMDYIMYRPWVMHNVKVPGRTTLTRVAENHIILRRSLSHVRRFGTCDEEESKYEIFSDKTTVDEDVERIGKATYNLTLVDTVEYSCVTVRARSYHNKTTPRIRIRRWCGSTSQFCYDQQHVEIKFHVIIFFNGPTTYEVSAYGRQIKTLNPMEAMKYINQFAKHPVMPEYSEFKNMFQRDSNGYFWVPGWEDGSYEGFKIRRYEVYEHCVSNTSSSDRRFCGLYEFAVEPDWWFDLTTKNENQRPASKYHHFVWRYLSQRQKLQYPTDGYELIIDPEKQDRRNERLERNQYKMKFFPLYNPPDYFVPQGNKHTNIYRLINTLPSSLCGVGNTRRGSDWMGDHSDQVSDIYHKHLLEKKLRFLCWSHTKSCIAKCIWTFVPILTKVGKGAGLTAEHAFQSTGMKHHFAVCPSVHQSVSPSVRPSVRLSPGCSSSVKRKASGNPCRCSEDLRKVGLPPKTKLNRNSCFCRNSTENETETEHSDFIHSLPNTIHTLPISLSSTTASFHHDQSSLPKTMRTHYPYNFSAPIYTAAPQGGTSFVAAPAPRSRAMCVEVSHWSGLPTRR
ncbi:hypothetical protein ABMA27_010043 [Loxostege sticticalis]|uniref:Peptidase S1 domain-containing protein n=1 Tax=Loxostege sticticalis TaxID=481309 RepID=A0ABR3H7C6_LOXSC